jgi:hypothetical protein
MSIRTENDILLFNIKPGRTALNLKILYTTSINMKAMYHIYENLEVNIINLISST